MERRKPTPKVVPMPRGSGASSHGGRWERGQLGKGHGGPAKGEGQHGVGARHPGRPKKGSEREAAIKQRRAEIRAITMATIEECYLMLTWLIYNGTPGERLQAVQTLLNRREGQPVQRTIAINGQIDVSELTEEQLDAELRKLDRKLGAVRPDDDFGPRPEPAPDPKKLN